MHTQLLKGKIWVNDLWVAFKMITVHVNCFQLDHVRQSL